MSRLKTQVLEKRDSNRTSIAMGTLIATTILRTGRHTRLSLIVLSNTQPIPFAIHLRRQIADLALQSNSNGRNHCRPHSLGVVEPRIRLVELHRKPKIIVPYVRV